MTVKPPNQQRSSPTASFSLSPTLLERVRVIGYARDVSMSRVVRDALDLALAHWTPEGAEPPVAAPEGRRENAPDPGPSRRTRSSRRPPTRLHIRPQAEGDDARREA